MSYFSGGDETAYLTRVGREFSAAPQKMDYVRPIPDYARRLVAKTCFLLNPVSV